MKEFPQEYESITLVTADGKKVEGVVLNEDSFTIQVMDTSEQVHSFDKERLKDYRDRHPAIALIHSARKVLDLRGEKILTGKLVGRKLTLTLTFKGLSGAANAAHIHTGKKGVSGPVALPLCPPGCKSPIKTTVTIPTRSQSAGGGNRYAI